MYKSFLFKISLLVTLGALLFSCKETVKNSIKTEYPGEWMYNQRAYPNNYINKKAINNSLTMVKELKNKANATWQSKGPINIGGRVTDIAISPTDNNTFYIGTAVGGVFKTTDKGQNWTPIFDNVGKPSIGNIEIAPSNSQRIYVGTGEANGSATSGANFGDGMYRSNDGGQNWTHIGLEQSNYISRIVVDPTNENRIFAGATGILYGKNEERGVYRSLDAGTNWEKVLYVNDSTAVIDVAMNPTNTNILFAATWERIRKPWQRKYGGLSSGIYRTLDGGDSWVRLTNGLPVNNQVGRIGLAISASNPNIIYATYTTNPITNTMEALYKSTNNGDTWTMVASTNIEYVNATFGWYFGNLRVHPNNSDEVWILGQRLVKTTNSGGFWEEISGMHVDYHSMEFSKTDPNFILMGCDGGIYLSENNGLSWNHFSNLPITQFYNIEVDELQPDHLFGGAQDNNTLRTLSGNNNDWQAILGGDGFQVNVDKNNSNNVYAEWQFGNLSRSTNGGNTMGYALDGINPNDRTNWNTPVEISPFNTNVLFYGSNNLYKSTNNAIFWNQISNDLTGGQHPSGSLSYGTLTCIAPSYNNLDVIYTGSDDGHVSVTFNGGTTWQTINTGLPNAFATQIAIDPIDDLTAYVTFSGFGFLDYSPHIFKTVDGGQNWLDISGNLPSVPINDVVITPNNRLIIATDDAVWFSDNNGDFWSVLGTDMPITIITDIKYHEPSNTLYAGTFGRSMFSANLDNVVASVTNNSIKNNIIVYPNPIKNYFKLSLNLENTTKAKIYFTDVNGKQYQTIYNDQIIAGKQELNLQQPNLIAGIYFLHIQTSIEHVVKKIVIK